MLSALQSLWLERSDAQEGGTARPATATQAAGHSSKSLVETFVHVPLPSDRHIRLIEVPPRIPEDGLPTPLESPRNCTLTQVHIDEAPLYAAISYTWEPNAEDAYIEMDRQKLKVKRNLVDLLCQLQDSTKPRTLWIDAICINQKDTAEKSTQVRMMGDIYASASYVIAYLWSNDAHQTKKLEKGAQYIRDLPLDRNPLVEYLAMCGVNDAEIATVMEKTGLEASSTVAQMLNTMHIWCSHRFWYRRWTVQETGLAQSVMVLAGKTMVSLANLGHLRKYFRETEFRRIFQATAAWKRFEQREKGIKSLSLSQALYRFRHTHCANVKDRILALVALSDNARKNFVVDYSLDVFDLACYTVAFACEHEQLPSPAVPSMACLVAEQLSLRLPGFASSHVVNGLSMRHAISVPFQRQALTVEMSRDSLAESHVNFARDRLTSLASVGPDDLSIDRLLRPNADDSLPLTHRALSDGSSIADRVVSTLDAQAFLSTVTTSSTVGLAGCRLTSTDQVWLLPGLPLALIARLSTPTSGQVVAFAHLLKIPRSAEALRQKPVRVVLGQDFTKSIGLPDATTQATGPGKVLHFSVPTLLRIGRLSSMR